MAGLASLLRRGRGFGSRIKRFPAPEVPGIPTSGEARRGRPDRQGWQAGGHVKGYQMGGRTMNPRAAGWAAQRRQQRFPTQNNWERRVPMPNPPLPRGWQEGGPVGVSPEEVEMAAEIYAMATPEQQAQITGGGGPGMMDEEAAIGEALEMALGGGGGPAMGGPPMGGGGPPMGGMI